MCGIENQKENAACLALNINVNFHHWLYRPPPATLPLGNA